MYISSICVVEILYKGMLSCISSQLIQWLHVDSLKMESPMLYNAIISFLDLKCFYFPFIQTYFLSLPFLLCIFPLWSDKCFFAKELREKKIFMCYFFLESFLIVKTIVEGMSLSWPYGYFSCESLGALTPLEFYSSDCETSDLNTWFIP